MIESNKYMNSSVSLSSLPFHESYIGKILLPQGQLYQQLLPLFHLVKRARLHIIYYSLSRQNASPVIFPPFRPRLV